MNQNKLHRKSKLVALISFIIGSMLLLLYFLSDSIELAYFSYFVIISLSIINLFVLVLLVINLITISENRKRTVIAALIVCCNIPISILYFYVVILLANTVRITFINETGQSISNISILGCETKNLDKLDSGESKTFWINIPNDCSIKLEYNLNGTKKQEVIYDYMTGSNGGKSKYQIGINKGPIDGL